jgi:hypothetical protein
MNVYQAALKLREDYAHVDGFMTDVAVNEEVNAYFIYHDALHALLGLAPEEEFEPQVLATELVLGGKDYSFTKVSKEDISEGLSSLSSDNLKDLTSFYTAYFS